MPPGQENSKTTKAQHTPTNSQEQDNRTQMTMMHTEIPFPDGTSHHQPTGLLINNQFQPSADGSTFETVNPYTQKAICNVAQGKLADIDRAVAAAEGSFPKWKRTTPQERGRILHRLADLVERDADILAKIEVRPATISMFRRRFILTGPNYSP